MPEGKVDSYVGGILGTAIDYRIRYYFGVGSPKEFIAWQGMLSVGGPEQDIFVDFFASLTNVLDELRPINRRLERKHEALLARYCVVLALLEQMFRAPIQSFVTSPLFKPFVKRSVPELLAIAEDYWVDDLCTLSWAFYEDHSDLLTQPAILNPKFDGSRDVGGADADFIVGGCLVDIKATIRPKLTAKMLNQLLGYALLDYTDSYRIREIAVYFARQRKLVRWPLKDLANILADGHTLPLNELRNRFRYRVGETANRKEPLQSSVLNEAPEDLSKFIEIRRIERTELERKLEDKVKAGGVETNVDRLIAQIEGELPRAGAIRSRVTAYRNTQGWVSRARAAELLGVSAYRVEKLGIYRKIWTKQQGNRTSYYEPHMLLLAENRAILEGMTEEVRRAGRNRTSGSTRSA